MNRKQLAAHALELLRSESGYLADAREGAPVGNSIVGSLMSIQFGAPRQLTEVAVMDALSQLDREDAKPASSGAIRLTRSGLAPLAFDGELLAKSDGERQAGKENNRWHELAVYRTVGGKYVVRIAYRTRWQGELDADAAAVVDDASEVAESLRIYDPTEPVQGFPAGDAYAEKQSRLLADVRRRYDAQVSEILASAPEFAERVD